MFGECNCWSGADIFKVQLLLAVKEQADPINKAGPEIRLRWTSPIMSEAQPLLAHDPESPHNKSAKPSWRARTANFLQHPILHKSVIALVSYLYAL